MLYSCYYNKIGVIVEGINSNNLRLESEDCDIIKATPGCFYIRLKTDKTSVQFKLYNKIKLIDSFYREVSFDIPLPNIHLGGVRGHSNFPLKLSGIYLLSSIGNKYTGEMGFKINSFIVDLISKEEHYSEYTNGQEFSDKVKNKYQNMKIGDKVVIRCVIFEDSTGRPYMIPKKEFIIH